MRWRTWHFQVQMNKGGLVSKGTAVLRRWESTIWYSQLS